MDFKKTEKRFADDEILEEKEDLKEDITMNSVTAVLKQFIEAANYAEFGLRMQLLKSFEFYLLKLSGQDVGKKGKYFKDFFCRKVSDLNCPYFSSINRYNSQPPHVLQSIF